MLNIKLAVLLEQISETSLLILLLGTILVYFIANISIKLLFSWDEALKSLKIQTWYAVLFISMAIFIQTVVSIFFPNEIKASDLISLIQNASLYVS